jgi:hypothetical protein
LSSPLALALIAELCAFGQEGTSDFVSSEMAFQAAMTRALLAHELRPTFVRHTEIAHDPLVRIIETLQASSNPTDPYRYGMTDIKYRRTIAPPQAGISAFVSIE